MTTGLTGIPAARTRTVISGGGDGVIFLIKKIQKWLQNRRDRK
jgi:hypothetical protein